MASGDSRSKPTPARRRATLFDYVAQAEHDASTNKYCDRSVLKNEATVEQFFVQRLLEDLNYTDTEIKPKSSLGELVIPTGGRKKESYKPDYALVCGGKPRWLLDAKGVDEKVEKWAYQGAGYALGLNQGFLNEDPCRYYVITNGLTLSVWSWNEADPILTLDFVDFEEDSPLFIKLRTLLGAPAARRGWDLASTPKSPTVAFKKPSVEEMKRIFKQCHDLIWRAEKMNPQPAFFEFVKVMFVKLWQDKKLHNDPELAPLIAIGEPLPRERVVFSTRWIDELEANGVANPIDRVLFERLTQTLVEAVANGKKKPIFGVDERIKLHPGTIKQVVSRLESVDMFGIDEDLNGRLFETFLSATMRGESLGQYFTPRSIVKLMSRLAHPRANRDHVDRVLDACCGTGGFLIEALTDMRNEIRANNSLTAAEAESLNEEVANQALFGIDAGQDPPLARIARINMYLHGDGGSRIYAADSLDKTVQTGVGDGLQANKELEELRSEITNGEVFDIVLTNPPFSMGYSEGLPHEKRILDQYELAKWGFAGTAKARPSLTSRVMFIERYHDLLKPGGKMLMVIDDATLSTKNYAFARQFLRDRFIIRAVISLPGDAFQRVGARAKTSILFLEKRKPGEAGQPSVFMAESSYVGLDDVPTKTPKSKADEARARADEEATRISDAFSKFLSGAKGPWLVPASALEDRLDVKSCLPRTKDVAEQWAADGYDVLTLADIVEPIEGPTLEPSAAPDTMFTFLRVTYDGIAEDGEQRLGGEVTYRKAQRAHIGDLVVSNINMVHGAICVMSEEFVPTLIASEFTVMRVKDKRFDPWFLWGFLRSPEVRARLLSQTTGMGRHRATWDFLKEIPVPVVDSAFQHKIAGQYRKAVADRRAAERSRRAAETALNGALDLENEWAVQRLRSAKPPK